eukprot:PhF_6_TR1456/c0_g1_i1/m.2620
MSQNNILVDCVAFPEKISFLPGDLLYYVMTFCTNEDRMVCHTLSRSWYHSVDRVLVLYYGDGFYSLPRQDLSRRRKPPQYQIAPYHFTKISRKQRDLLPQLHTVYAQWPAEGLAEILSNCTSLHQLILLPITYCKAEPCSTKPPRGKLVLGPSVKRVDFSTIETAPLRWVKAAPNIEELHLSGSDVCDADVISLFSGCGSTIKRIEMSHAYCTSNASVISIAEHCPNLEALVISKNYNAPNDESLGEILRNCSRLRLLDVSYAQNVTDVSMMLIALCGSQLTSLDVSCTSGHITDDGMKELLMGPCGKSLTHLNISSSNSRITDATLQVIATQCSSLKSLRVNNMWGGVTNAGLKAITALAQLTYVDVSSNSWPTITDDVIESFANMRSLRVLNVENNSKVTELSVQPLQQLCPKLQIIHS